MKLLKEMKMKKFNWLVVLALTFVGIRAAAFIGYNSSGTMIAKTEELKCSSGLSCAKTAGKFVMQVAGDGDDVLYGFLHNQVAATATTITASQCGSTFYNTGAVAINLPDGASTLIGCRITFITLNATNFDINPGNSDQIVLLTDAAGDSIRNATIGNTVTLQYAATNKWIDVGHIGTWSDIN